MSLEGNQLAGVLLILVDRRNRGAVCSKTPSRVSNLFVLVSGFAKPQRGGLVTPPSRPPSFGRILGAQFSLIFSRSVEKYFSVCSATMLDVFLAQTECVTFTATRPGTHQIYFPFSIYTYTPKLPVFDT